MSISVSEIEVVKEKCYFATNDAYRKPAGNQGWWLWQMQ